MSESLVSYEADLRGADYWNRIDNLNRLEQAVAAVLRAHLMVGPEPTILEHGQLEYALSRLAETYEEYTLCR